MKTIAVVLLFLLVSVSGFSQKKGRYWYHNEWNSSYITFKSFHRFQYTYSGESQKIEGFGKYKRRGGKLILNFQTNATIAGPENTVVEHTPTPSKAAMCELKIHVADKSHKDPLPYAKIGVFKKESMLAGAVSDGQGNCKLQVFADGEMIDVQVKHDEFDEEHILLKAAGNYDITFVMEEHRTKTQHYKKGDQLIFYFAKKPTKKNLYLSSTKLTPEYSKYESYYTSVYKRIGR